MLQSNPFSIPSCYPSKEEEIHQTPPGSPKSHLPYASTPSTPPGSPKSHLPYASTPSTPPGSPKSHLPYASTPSTPPGSPKSHLPSTPHSDSFVHSASLSSPSSLAEKAFQPSAELCPPTSCKSTSSSISRVALLFSLVLFSTHCHLSLQLASFLVHLLLCGVQASSSSSTSLSVSSSLFDSPSSVFTFACHVLDASSWLAFLFPVFFPHCFDHSLLFFPKSLSFLSFLRLLALQTPFITFSQRVPPNP